MDYFGCENTVTIPNKAMRQMLIPSHAYATSYFEGTTEFVESLDEHGTAIACLMFEKSVKQLIKDYGIYMD